MKQDKEFIESTFTISSGTLPYTSCVYAVIVTEVWNSAATPVVVYIGSTNDLRHRVRGERHIYKRLLSLTKSYIVNMAYKTTRNYKSLEVEMIKKYRPRFNKTHNG